MTQECGRDVMQQQGRPVAGRALRPGKHTHTQAAAAVVVGGWGGGDFAPTRGGLELSILHGETTCQADSRLGQHVGKHGRAGRVSGYSAAAAASTLSSHTAALLFESHFGRS